MDIVTLIISSVLLPALFKKALEKSSLKVAETTSTAVNSVSQRVEYEFKDDPKTLFILSQIKDRNSERVAREDLKIIYNALKKKFERDPVFLKDIQDKLKTLEEQLYLENADIAKEYHNQLRSISDSVKYLQEDIDGVKKQIFVNVNRGDYVGKDAAILSGNQIMIGNSNKGIIGNSHIVEHNISINDFGSNNQYAERIIMQIEQIKGKITQSFTVRENMDELNRIRQPGPIFEGYIEQELKFRIPIPIVGDFSFRRLVKNKDKPDLDTVKQVSAAEDYFSRIKTIESQVGIDLEKDKVLLQSLGSIADEINLGISRINNSFILSLYPATSSKELVANMVSKIGYKDLREEGEMHLSVIGKLVDKLNALMKKFDIDGLENTQKGGISISSSQENSALIQAIAFRLKGKSEMEVESNLQIIKNIIVADSRNEDFPKDQKEEGDSIYVLSDEAQAAIGMMIDIEKRRFLVEDLVRLDRRTRNRTTQLVTMTIFLIIGLMIVAGFKYGPLVTVGEKSLDEMKLPLFNVPWPVIFWSFVGSFAAMIYRFNRQPIHEFGDIVKWTITRLVQGIVLGSAFYLILVSGLSLLTGITPVASTASQSSQKITTEVILILSFLVGFSDRFADSVFNTLIEKYSKEVGNDTRKSNDKESET
jgi:hypothetical protein